MANTNIEWTNGGKVWNPVTGCNKVSAGCKNCYAEKMHKRLKGMGMAKYQRNFLDGAFPYDADAGYPTKIKKPTTFFVNSMSDLFHENIPWDYIDVIFNVMELCPQHTFQILTKRPEIMQAYLTDQRHYINYESGVWPLQNVWLGTSVENMATAESRIPYLQNTPAYIRFLSMEPLLEAVDLNKVFAVNGIEPSIDWIIVGGESGAKRRPFETDWARSIRDFCKYNDIAFFMKQIDKVKEIPSTLMIRQYPKKVVNPSQPLNPSKTVTRTAETIENTVDSENDIL